MSLNVAVVINSELRHKYFACELDKRVNVKCIFVVKQKIKRNGLLDKIRQQGFGLVLLKILSIIYNKYSSKSYIRKLKVTETIFFEKYDEEFNKLKNKVYCIKTVNDREVISLVFENNIDIICNLGGDIAKKDFIASARLLCLNIHSGLSPFYNGSQSTAWAFTNQRPNFCGITLMKMNERIDGGDILAHYLPSIDINDTADTLFCKGIVGGVNSIIECINYIQKYGLVKGIPQNRTFIFTRGIDWNIVYDIKLNLAYRDVLVKRYLRKEKYIFYFDNINNITNSISTLTDFLLKKTD
jgi:folate-dependent phosphoribosylglycinamide formyltransferase PurN